MDENYRGRFLHLGTLGVLALIILGGLAIAYPTWRRGKMLRLQEAQLKVEIEEKRREIEHFIDNQRRFKTDRDFVETIARRNRRVFPGELVFVFDD